MDMSPYLVALVLLVDPPCVCLMSVHVRLVISVDPVIFAFYSI